MSNLYVLRNRNNGKLYVGQTKCIKKRLAQYRCQGKKKKQLIDHAITKHGWENFEVFQFLDIPIDTIDHFEIEMIKKLNTQRPYGYNLEGGGNKNKTHSPESNKKRSLAISGEKHHFFGKKADEKTKALLLSYAKQPRSEETRRKIGDAHRGMKFSEESLKKMSASHRGKNMSSDNYLSKPIMCIDTGEIFECGMDAVRKYKLHSGHLSQACKGKLKSHKGMRWEYFERDVK